MTVINSELNEHIITFFFHNFYLMFPICDKKDFENFLILSMIVIFALTILSRSILVVLALAYLGYNQRFVPSIGNIEKAM